VSGIAVSDSLNPLGALAAQIFPQDSPGIELLIVPCPILFIESTKASLNSAVTSLADTMLTEQLEELPEQAPLHPLNMLLDSSLAYRVTFVPLSNGAIQEAPQLMPAG
jgi:hypothetical protein